MLTSTGITKTRPSIVCLQDVVSPGEAKRIVAERKNEVARKTAVESGLCIRFESRCLISAAAELIGVRGSGLLTAISFSSPTEDFLLQQLAQDSRVYPHSFTLFDGAGQVVERGPGSDTGPHLVRYYQLSARFPTLGELLDDSEYAHVTAVADDHYVEPPSTWPQSRTQRAAHELTYYPFPADCSFNEWAEICMRRD